MTVVPGLVVDDLDVTERDGRSLLRLPRLDLAPGGILAVHGPSGAGKSTLLHAVAGLLPSARGRIAWDALDLTEASDAERAAFRRDKLGFVFQDNHLFEELGTHANAELSALYAPRERRRAIRDRATQMLSAFGLSDALHRNTATLSGGERQRVSVARALASDPAVVLADEPTAALDRATSDRVADDLFGWVRANGRSMIVVSHDPAILDRADRRLELRDGQPVGETRHG